MRILVMNMMKRNKAKMEMIPMIKRMVLLTIANMLMVGAVGAVGYCGKYYEDIGSE